MQQHSNQRQNEQENRRVTRHSRELTEQNRQIFSAEVINSGINDDFGQIMQFNEPIHDDDGEPVVVDMTDDFDDQDDQILSKQRSGDQEAQYFDNRDQFLSTEEQQRKLTTISYSINDGKKGGSNIFNVNKKGFFMSNITEQTSSLNKKSGTFKKKASQQYNPSKSSHKGSQHKESITN